MLAGDAMKVLPKRIATASISVLYVNHPEPPQQTGKEDFDTQASHLLDPKFFAEVDRIIKPDGFLTIVTDNLWYD